MAPELVWFKRDLRLADHQPLADAIAAGRPVLLMYCFEPMLLDDPHHSARHWRFVGESLRDMNAQLRPLASLISPPEMAVRVALTTQRSICGISW